MALSQQPNLPKTFTRATARQRLIAAIVFLAIAGSFTALWLIAHYNINLYPFPCGFKQRYGLPCPTCGFTHAVLYFAQGQIIRSFYAQPAAGLFCGLAVVTAFFAFLIAAFGLYSPTFERFILSLKLRYIIAALVLVLAAGWAFTLAKTLAEHSGH
ncbi:MAG: DUF2752 domain-containing protein [Planctomycetota bacterium]